VTVSQNEHHARTSTLAIYKLLTVTLPSSTAQRRDLARKPENTLRPGPGVTRVLAVVTLLVIDDVHVLANGT